MQLVITTVFFSLLKKTNTITLSLYLLFNIGLAKLYAHPAAVINTKKDFLEVAPLFSTATSKRQCTSSLSNGTARLYFPKNVLIPSLTDSIYGISIQGIIDNFNNRISIIIPYTDGHGRYSSYRSKATTVVGEDGETNRVSISYPAGVFTKQGKIIVTLLVEDKSMIFRVKKQVPGEQATVAILPVYLNGVMQGAIVLKAIGGIPDRAFVKGNGKEHNFVYLPVLAEDGKIWLNHNLGANYANVNHNAFNPKARPIGANDRNAFGSLYQWGRFSDGHELISQQSELPLNDTTTTISRSDSLNSNLFIITKSNALYDWKHFLNNDLWQGLAYDNNPCPEGFRVPTKAEISNLVRVYGYINAEHAATKKLGFTLAGHRNPFSGAIEFSGSRGSYWTSTVSEGTAAGASWYSKKMIIVSNYRAYGFCVRCIMK